MSICDAWHPGLISLTPLPGELPANAQVLLVSRDLVTVGGLTHGVPTVELRAGSTALSQRPEAMFRVGIQAVGIFSSLPGGSWLADVTYPESRQACRTAVLIGLTPDTTPPVWLEPPMVAAPSYDAQTWAGVLSEPGYLLVWSEQTGRPFRLVTFPSECGGSTFSFVDPTQLYAGHRTSEIDTRIAVCEAFLPWGPVIVRPMDLAGNLGDAWSIDPDRQQAAVVTGDLKRYTWSTFLAGSRPWP